MLEVQNEMKNDILNFQNKDLKENSVITNSFPMIQTKLKKTGELAIDANTNAQNIKYYDKLKNFLFEVEGQNVKRQTEPIMDVVKRELKIRDFYINEHKNQAVYNLKNSNHKGGKTTDKKSIYIPLNNYNEDSNRRKRFSINGSKVRTKKFLQELETVKRQSISRKQK